jgi:hypothetical protein
MPGDFKRLPIKKISKALVLSIIVMAFVYAMCLCFPEPFFGDHVQYENLRLYSDRSLPKEALPVLKEVQRRLMKSAIYDPQRKYHVFICNSPTRFKFFANFKYRVGGLNYELFRRNSFLRNADIPRDRLIGPSGNKVPGERTLTYFIAHEIVHGVIEARTNWFNYYVRLPRWIKDGYADYIAKDAFDFKENLAKYKSASREMNPKKSGLYLKYHLFVAYLLDIRKIGTEKLLRNECDAGKIAASLKRM